jgi:hypothetical protein
VEASKEKEGKRKRGKNIKESPRNRKSFHCFFL